MIGKHTIVQSQYCNWTTQNYKEVMEREATQFMNGNSSRGEWVMQNRINGVVEDFDHTRDHGNIHEERIGDWVFVNRRAVKRVTQPEYKHNLYSRERVEFAKALGRG